MHALLPALPSLLTLSQPALSPFSGCASSVSPMAPTHVPTTTGHLRFSTESWGSPAVPALSL